MFYLYPLQVKNPTVVPGKAASGDLLGLTNWPDIIGSTRGSNPSNAVIVSAVFRAQTTLLCIWRDISRWAIFNLKNNWLWSKLVQKPLLMNLSPLLSRLWHVFEKFWSGPRYLNIELLNWIQISKASDEDFFSIVNGLQCKLKILKHLKYPPEPLSILPYLLFLEENDSLRPGLFE